MSCDWAALPAELLRTIAEMLTTDAADYIRFRAVCTTWQSSSPRTPPRLPTQLPWLLLPYTDPPESLRRQFYSLEVDKIYESISVPHISSLRRIGSSQGWLVFLNSSTSALSLLNPITGSTLSLPSLPSFTENVSIRKIVLSSNPCVDQNYIALAMLNQSDKIIFCKNGDQSWTFLDEAQSYCRDLVYRDGLFYTVNRFGGIVVCDVCRVKPRVSIINTSILKPGYVQYLANSSDNELLLVRRRLDFSPYIGYHTTRFKVFRLDLGGPRWDPVTDLGDEVVFLGENSTLALSRRRFHGCKGNSIYYTDDRLEYNYTEEDTDSGIYDLGNKSFERLPHCYNTYNSRFSPPFWLSPYPFL